MPLNNNVMWKYPSQKLVVRADNLMVTIDCPPQILVVSDNRKGLISNAGGGGSDVRSFPI